MGDDDDYRYSAPETRFPEDRSEDVNPITYERDVYGMGMITYEAGPHRHGSPGVNVKPYLILGPYRKRAILRV